MAATLAQPPVTQTPATPHPELTRVARWCISEGYEVTEVLDSGWPELAEVMTALSDPAAGASVAWILEAARR